MKYIREVSDIHLDFDIDHAKSTYGHKFKVTNTCALDHLWAPPELPEDLDTTLILAGDLWTDRKFLTQLHPVTNLSWMQLVAPRFKYVVLVLGNHDYWEKNIDHEASKTKLELARQGLKNVYLLDDDVFVLDQVKFIGSTLWTDYKNGNPMTMMRSGVMRDYDLIRQGSNYQKLQPQHVLDIHRVSRKFIFDNATRDDPDQKVVVVTHMAPSSQSIDERYQSNPSDYETNFYYFSELAEPLHDPRVEIDLWFHGHTHTPKDYTIDRTRVIVNPRGYQGYETTGYDPLLRLEV